MPTATSRRFGTGVTFTLAAAILLVLLLSIAASAAGQSLYEVKVNVDANRSRNIMSFRAVALDAAVWDGKLVNDEVFNILRAVGVTALRYPGPAANRYHWATNNSTRMAGSEPAKYDFYPTSNSFGEFAKAIEKIGATAIVTVNYGSNQEGTEGAQPVEAAAWVAYANGDPSDTKPLGKDSSGTDWKTVGFWAAMRSSAPLATDDGFNFLRISHPQPFRFKYWEIGNDTFANGYYMKDGQNNSEEDLHAPHGNTAKEEEKLRRSNPKLSPEAYGNTVVAFSNAMKAIDPTVKIGAVLIPPPVKGAFAQRGASIEHWNGAAGPGGYLSGVGSGGIEIDTSQIDWNPSVLKACGGIIDFAVIRWRFAKYLPPDWKNPDIAGLLAAPHADLPQIVSGLVDLFNKYAGPNARNVQFAVSGIQAGGVEKDPLVSSLLLADNYMSLIEDGALALVATSVHDTGFLDSDNKPGPLAFAVGMVHIIARPNDPVLDSESTSSMLAVHSAKRADGSIGLMLINKDPEKTAKVRVSIKNANLSAKGARFDFGRNTNGQPIKGALDTGATFIVEVPSYTITDVVLPKAQ